MTILLTLENPERTGAPRMALEYARALVRAGHRVLAACGPETKGVSSILGDLEDAGVEVLHVPPFAPRNAPGILRRLYGVVRDERVDCVVGFQQRDRALACMVARLTRTPCVASAQNQHMFRGSAAERRLKAWVYGTSLRSWADLVICTSEVVEDEIRTFGVGARRTTVLPNGIDVEAFPVPSADEARAARRELGLEDGDRLLLNVGRIDRQKGQDILLRAFRAVADRYPRVHLGIVGAVGRSAASEEARRYESDLKAMVANGGKGRVQFLGWRDDVPRLLAAADVYVQPSRWEGWPVALMEAMAAGRTVVASDCSGRPRGFVDGKHGWIVPTGDVGALRDALSESLAMSSSMLGTMGERARSLVGRHYDIHGLGRQFVALVEGTVR